MQSVSIQTVGGALQYNINMLCFVKLLSLPSPPLRPEQTILHLLYGVDGEQCQPPSQPEASDQEAKPRNRTCSQIIHNTLVRLKASRSVIYHNKPISARDVLNLPVRGDKI